MNACTTTPTVPAALDSERGMTLVEVMIGMTLSALVLGGALSTLIFGSNFASYNHGKLLVNRDIRSFTSELTDNATYANYYVIYRSFLERDILNDGMSGDFLVLVYRDPEDPQKTERLVGYYHSADDAQEGPVRKFDIVLHPPSEQDLADLLPAMATEDHHPEVIELSRGLSDGRLFYNYLDRSIVVRGEILHDGSVVKRASNTYNFTVSPRG